MKKITLTVCGALAVLGLVSGGCGGSDPPVGTGGVGTGGAGTGGSLPGTGGASTGGTSTGGTSTGGVSTGGTDFGGMGGGAGAGADSGGSDSGSGGAPVVRTACDDIPSLGAGDNDLFVVTVDGFEFCEPIPAEHTCEAKPFPEGTSPEVSWSAGPAGTLSYAVVFKDLSVLEINDPSNAMLYNRGFHWAIWDIPAATRTLPAGLPEGDALSLAGLVDARQWASFKDYSFFGPCPNFDPEVAEEVTDSYSFVVYALPFAPASLIPNSVTTTSPVRAMDDYFKSIAIAVTEYRGTSDAHADELDPGLFPPTAVPPCPSGGAQPDVCLAAP